MGIPGGGAITWAGKPGGGGGIPLMVERGRVENGLPTVPHWLTESPEPSQVARFI